MPNPELEILGHVVDVTTWQRDEEYQVHPYGAKAKRLLLCPADAPHPQLIAGHRYFFKYFPAANERWKAQQTWSEVIAYQIGRLGGLDVPRSFLAFDGRTGDFGALIEFFLDYPGGPVQDLLHGADALQGARRLDQTGNPHVVSLNVDFCHEQGIEAASIWWGRTLAFDALIGNSDRHAQNWGFLTTADGPPTMAPVFDNGTSLAYQVLDSAIPARSTRVEIDRFIEAGRHRCRWEVADPKGGQHQTLCKNFAERYPEAREHMINVAATDMAAMEETLAACVALDADPLFTAARAELVLALLEGRQQRLLEGLGG